MTKEEILVEKAIKTWISLRCPHCRKRNPIDTTKCIYCGRIIRR